MARFGSQPRGSAQEYEGHKFSSGLEVRVYEALKTAQSDLSDKKAPIRIEYETERVPYIVEKKYVPDFIVTRPDGSKIYIESKGRFLLEDRQKMLAVKEQHPDKTFALLFQRNLPITKGSSTLYSDWAEHHGFLWAINELPLVWLYYGQDDVKFKKIDLELIWIPQDNNEIPE